MVPMMMAPVVVMPPVMVAPVAEVTDAPRPVMGPDHPAAAVRVIVVGVVVVVVGRPDKEAPVKTMMPEREPAVTNAAGENMSPRRQSSVKGRACAEPAMKYGASTAVKRRGTAVRHRTSAAVKRRAPAMECRTAAAVEATTTMPAAAAMTATTAMASDFSRKCASSGFRRGQRASTWQRQRVGAMRGGR
jgi:hypothetical protein